MKQTWPKNKNVQEQVNERLSAMLKSGKWFRDHYLDEIEALVIACLKNNNINLDEDFVDYWDDSDIEGSNSRGAIIRMMDGTMLEAYICLTDDGDAIEEFDFRDVSHDYPVSNKEPGIGATTGWIYMQAHHYLNAANQPNAQENRDAPG